MIIDTSCYPTNLVDLAWRHDGEPFSGERLIEVMDGPYIINGKPRRIEAADQLERHKEGSSDQHRSPEEDGVAAELAKEEPGRGRAEDAREAANGLRHAQHLALFLASGTARD